MEIKSNRILQTKTIVAYPPLPHSQHFNYLTAYKYYEKSIKKHNYKIWIHSLILNSKIITCNIKNGENEKENDDLQVV